MCKRYQHLQNWSGCNNLTLLVLLFINQDAESGHFYIGALLEDNERIIFCFVDIAV